MDRWYASVSKPLTQGKCQLMKSLPRWIVPAGGPSVQLCARSIWNLRWGTASGPRTAPHFTALSDGPEAGSGSEAARCPAQLVVPCHSATGSLGGRDAPSVPLAGPEVAFPGPGPSRLPSGYRRGRPGSATASASVLWLPTEQGPKQPSLRQLQLEPRKQARACCFGGLAHTQNARVL